MPLCRANESTTCRVSSFELLSTTTISQSRPGGSTWVPSEARVCRSRRARLYVAMMTLQSIAHPPQHQPPPHITTARNGPTVSDSRGACWRLDLSENLTAAMQAVPPKVPRVSVTSSLVERCMIFEHGSHIARGELS